MPATPASSPIHHPSGRTRVCRFAPNSIHTWPTIRILPASPDHAAPSRARLPVEGFVPPGSKIRSLRVSSPCSALREWQKHEVPRCPRPCRSSTLSKAFPLLHSGLRLLRSSHATHKWRKLEGRLHGSSDSEQVYCQEAQNQYAIAADLLVAHAGVRPVRQVTWLRIPLPVLSK